ncbi:MAG: nucleotidyltransferase family protein [Caldilineaceae bacterium]|nr:nucleotidyltransferase family protein [Caldilineaceae bacterium]
MRCLSRQPFTPQLRAAFQLEESAWEELAKVAQRQRVAPLFYQRIQQHALQEWAPEHVLTLLHGAQRENAIRNLRLYQALRVLLQALHAHEIPTLVLKGAYLAQAVYPDPSLRVMVDCDVMIPEQALATAVEILTELGYHPLKPIQLATNQAVMHHLPRFVKEKSDLSVEIHWTITRPDKSYTIGMDDLWARAQPFTVMGVETQALCVEDLLLHLCLHATHQHFLMQGVRPLCDLAALVAQYGEEIAWDAICQRSRAWGWSKGVYLALDLAQRWLGAAVPEEVLTRLRPEAVPPQLVESARAQLFAAYTELASSTSHHFMQVVADRPIHHKAQLLLERIMLSKAVLANSYGVPADSPWLYLYYPVRVWDLLVRYRPQVWRYWRGEGELETAAHHRHRLVEWLG